MSTLLILGASSERYHYGYIIDSSMSFKVMLVTPDSFVTSSRRVLVVRLCKEHVLLYHKLFSFYVTVRTLFLSNWLEVGYTERAFYFLLAKGDFKIFVT